MPSWGSNLKAKGITDRLKSWKYLIEWPKVNGTVIWLHLALSHLLIKVKGQILYWTFLPTALETSPASIMVGRRRWLRSHLALTNALSQRLSCHRTAELVFTLPQVSLVTVSWAEIAESLFLAMRREIASAQLGFLITGWVCKAQGQEGRESSFNVPTE